MVAALFAGDRLTQDVFAAWREACVLAGHRRECALHEQRDEKRLQQAGVAMLLRQQDSELHT